MIDEFEQKNIITIFNLFYHTTFNENIKSGDQSNNSFTVEELHRKCFDNNTSNYNNFHAISGEC